MNISIVKKHIRWKNIRSYISRISFLFFRTETHIVRSHSPLKLSIFAIMIA